MDFISDVNSKHSGCLVLQNILKVIFGKNAVIDYLCLPRA